jgi:NAD(P)-dependent dehydrogenase (short-subunit alcohol dehydrogenase family)
MPSDLFGLKDRVVVVTGGAGQLGQAFVQALGDAGARVVVLDTRKIEAGPSMMSVSCSVTSRDQLAAALAEIQARWDTPYGLVNAAAIDAPPNAPLEENGPFETYPMASWERIMDVNVKGVFLCCQVFGGAMAARGRGSIVNVASIYGMVSPDQALYQYRRDRGEEFYKPVAYSVSKSAIYNLTRYLAAYWGPRGVRVNTVTFGGVFNDQDPQFLDAYCRKVPLGRMAAKSEYNGVVQFLLSDAASYMTGANVVADGGFTTM